MEYMESCLNKGIQRRGGFVEERDKSVNSVNGRTRDSVFSLIYCPLSFFILWTTTGDASVILLFSD